MLHGKKSAKDVTEYDLKKEDIFHVKKGEWHQIMNLSKKICKIIETNTEKVQESDIERLYFFDNKNHKMNLKSFLRYKLKKKEKYYISDSKGLSFLLMIYPVAQFLN